MILLHRVGHWSQNTQRRQTNRSAYKHRLTVEWACLLFSSAQLNRVSYFKWYPRLRLAILRLQIIFLSWNIKCCPKGHLLRTETWKYLEVLPEAESAQGHARGEVNAILTLRSLPNAGPCGWDYSLLGPGWVTLFQTRHTGRGQRGPVWRDPRHLLLCCLALAPSATVIRVFSLLSLPTTSV